MMDRNLTELAILRNLRRLHDRADELQSEVEDCDQLFRASSLFALGLRLLPFHTVETLRLLGECHQDMVTVTRRQALLEQRLQHLERDAHTLDAMLSLLHREVAL